MSWEQRLPDGVSNLKKTETGFMASVDIPTDDDGFFGRECSTCNRFFKMRIDQWQALPSGAAVTCPYCGAQSADPNDFLTAQQQERAMSALKSMAEQYAHEALRDVFRGLQRRSRSSAVKFTVNETLPPVRSVTTYVEEKVRRTIECENCQTAYAVYGATAFCPVCGPRAAVDNVLDSIERERRALRLEDELPQDLREQARADGVFDTTAANAVRETVTLFEVFTRDQFTAHVAEHEEIVKEKGRGVFQRLDDIDALFAEHLGTAISSHVGEDVWSRLRIVFQQRHVLVHRQGIVDEQYVNAVPEAEQQVGQRLVLDRRDADEALDAVEAVVRAVSAGPISPR